jgi:hypothetical protein
VIINIRGTGGSGKSTIIRKLLAGYSITEVLEPKRQNPIAYLCTHEKRCLAVLGSYTTPTGGCDTIPNIAKVFELVEQFHTRGFDVVFEGLLLTGLVNQIVEMWNRYEQKLPILVITLDTPLEVCVDSINTRRKARNPNADPVNPANTEAKWKGSRLAMNRLLAAGVPCKLLDREAALAECRKQFGLPAKNVPVPNRLGGDPPKLF